MKYLYVFVAIVAVWLGILCIALLPQSTNSRYGLYQAALAGTGILFIIGFWKRA